MLPFRYFFMALHDAIKRHNLLFGIAILLKLAFM